MYKKITVFDNNQVITKELDIPENMEIEQVIDMVYHYTVGPVSGRIGVAK